MLARRGGRRAPHPDTRLERSTCCRGTIHGAHGLRVLSLTGDPGKSDRVRWGADRRPSGGKEGERSAPRHAVGPRPAGTVSRKVEGNPRRTRRMPRSMPAGSRVASLANPGRSRQLRVTAGRAAGSSSTGSTGAPWLDHLAWRRAPRRRRRPRRPRWRPSAPATARTGRCSMRTCPCRACWRGCSDPGRIGRGLQGRCVRRPGQRPLVRTGPTPGGHAGGRAATRPRLQARFACLARRDTARRAHARRFRRPKSDATNPTRRGAHQTSALRARRKFKAIKSECRCANHDTRPLRPPTPSQRRINAAVKARPNPLYARTRKRRPVVIASLSTLRSAEDASARRANRGH